jgi:6-phosphogluconolactonase
MKEKNIAFIGAYTEAAYKGRARGIYSFTLDPESGQVRDLHLCVECVNPSYLAVSPSKEYLYAVNEVAEFNGAPSGAVSAFVIEDAGLLRPLNQKPSKGKDPCHIVIDHGGSYVMVSNYSSGSLSVLPVEDGGGLGEAAQVIEFSGAGPDPLRQEGPHAHSFLFDPAQRYGFVCDLGTDRLMTYSFDPHAALPLSPAAWFAFKPKSGPRHGVFDAAGTFCYILNELDSTIAVLQYDTCGGFEELQSIGALPETAAVSSTAAAIVISPDGNFVYASNRGHDSIAVFKRDKTAGVLSPIDCTASGGRIPRDIAIDPSGKFLLACNTDSDNLTVFRIDHRLGKLATLGEYQVPSPVCVKVI